MDLLKNAVKSLGGIKQEGKVIIKSINILKEDIKQIKIEIVQLAKKANTIEEACEYCKIHFGIRKFFENHIEQHMGKGIIKCLECL